MIKPRFSPEINWGHLLQAVVILLTIGGGAITSYVSLRDEISAQAAEFRVTIAGHELRIAAAERDLADTRISDRQFQVEIRAALEKMQLDTRASLDKIIEALADLRTQIVQKQDRR